MDLENLQQQVERRLPEQKIILDNHKTHIVHLEEPCLQKPLFQRGYNLHLTKDASHHFDKTLLIGYLQESQLVVRNVTKAFQASRIDVYLRLLL